MTTTIEHVSSKRFFKECHGLFKNAYKEVFGKDNLYPDIELFYSERDLSYFLLLNEKKHVVGCAAIVFYIEPFSNELFASNEVIYVMPEYRKPFITGKFIKFLEKFAKDNNAKNFLWDLGCNSTLISTMEKHPKYSMKGVYFEKKL